MNEPHPLQVTSSDQKIIESVDARFITDGLLRARERTIQAVEKIKNEVREGMTELEARILALEIFAAAGATKHWHQPYIRFGVGTTLTFHNPLQPDYRLAANDPFYVDVGPVWRDEELALEYEGDYGDTFIFGKNADAEACANTVRSIFMKAKNLWKHEKASGIDLYHFMKEQAKKTGYFAVDQVDGHRLSDFPHQKYTRERLAKTHFAPSPHLWVLELQIKNPESKYGAFFEDILF